MDDDTSIRVVASSGAGRPVELLMWVDLETTGLQRASSILEIAMVATDQALRVQWQKAIVLEFRPTHTEPEAMTMHTANGLLTECRSSLRTEGEVETGLFWEIVERGFVGRPMAGSGVCFDRWVLADRMPRLASLFSHRQFDTRALLPLLDYPKIERRHRAAADIEQDIRLTRRAFGWA